MAPRSILAQLVVALRDDASGPAKALSGTLKGLEKSAVDFAKTMNGAKWGSAFTKQLGGLKATQDEIAKIKASWVDLQSHLSGAKGRLRTDAQRQWANEWVTRLQAVRVAQQQNTEEAIRNAKRQAVEEKRAAATTAREQARLARETVREKELAARQAARAAVQADRDVVRSAKAAAREKASEERRAAIEAAKAHREAARERDKIARSEASAARMAARERATAARVSAREAFRAEREAAREARGRDRGARAIGRSVVSNLGYAAGLGSGTYVAGRGARAGVRAGGEAMREEARDYLAGLSEKDSGRIGTISTEQSAKYKSLTATSLHSLYRETATTALGMEGMAAVAPSLAQGMTVLQSLKGRDEALSQLTGFMRALDTLGKNVNPADVRSLLDGMARAAGVQGVEYQPKQVFTMAKQARSAGGALSNDFLNQIAPSLIADMGPAAPGTALATMMSSVVGGTLSGGNTKQKLARQRELGLRNGDNSLPSGDRDMMTQNPHLYAWNRLMPTLEKRGIDVKNESAVAEELNKLFTRTVADLFGKLISQKDQYQNTQRRLAGAPGLGGADALDQKDPFVAAGGVSSQMVNAAAEISKPIIETILPALGQLSGMLNALANSIRNNPEFAKTFGDTGAGAAAGGLLGGAGMALRALWQGRGVNGALAGGLKGGLVGGVGGGLLGFGASKLGEWASSAIGGIGRAAAGAKWAPKSAEDREAMEGQLQGIQQRIAGIRSRTHPSRANEPNPEIDRLEGEAADLRNRLGGGAAGRPRFKISNVPENAQGNAASNSFFNGAPLAGQSLAPSLTETKAPSGLFGASLPGSSPAPTVDAAAAASNGQAAGTALGSGVATGIAAQAPAVEAQGRSLMERIKAMFAAGVTVPVNIQQGGGTGSGGSSTPAAPARASGGSVSAGSLYRVNEYGEEFFQPSEDGNIVDPRRMKGGAGGGGNTASISMSNSFSISGASDPQAVIDQVVAALQDRIQDAARGAFADMGVELA